MRAVLPLHAIVIDQPHISFVDQCSCLEAVTGPLAPHVAPCKRVEFVVNDRRQLL
jgi:hypothetical protein